MSERRSGRRSHWTGTVPAVFAVGLMLLSPVLARPASATYPALPDSDWSGVLSGLGGPTLTPGAEGALSFQVGNPLSSPLASPHVALLVYAFNPTDGGAPQAPPKGGTPAFAGGALGTNLSLPTLAPGATWGGTVPVTVPATAPTGDYAVRFAVSFSVGNLSYLLESRGYFSAAAWTAATELSNGTPTINASQLGVSGVVAETSILVSAGSTSVALYVVLGVGLGLAALGAYWWTRSEAKSRSGAR
ncbi:MAG: NEW3 domain-containing protein [Thermoplasmata archaeon]|nr:NEW3 domain-containing protein [Thermoplasmata archaeon]